MVSFPIAIDSFTDPTGTDPLNSPPHDTQHSNVNAAITAIETKLGVDATVPIVNSVLAGTASGHSSYTADPNIDSLILVEEAAPAVSAAGHARVYADTSHVLYASINGGLYKKVIRTGDDFVASGGSHASGLVPDPGASAGTTKFLAEDATWKTPAAITNLRTVYASRPAAGVQGRLWQASDSIYEAFDDGANWQERVYGRNVKSTNGFPSTWFNQPSSATKDASLGGLIVTCVPDLSLDQALITKTLSPPYTITTSVIVAHTLYSISGGGMAAYWAALCVLDPVGGKFIDIAIEDHNAGAHLTLQVSVNEWTDKNTYSALLYAGQLTTGSDIIWLRIADNSSTRSFQISYDGINYFTIFSHSSGTFVTPTAVGLESTGFYNNAGTPPTNTVNWYVSWDES